MAYAAVISLLGAIDGLFDSRCISLGTSTRECLQSVHDHATSLATTLERCSEGVGALEEEVIIEEARRFEDSIEFPLSTHILLLQSQIGEPTFSLNLNADSFARTARKMKENIQELWEQKVSETIEEYVKELFVPKTEEVSSATDECDMVGLFDQFLWIRDKLVASEKGPLDQSVIRISGMAGIGKTRLARKLLQDPSVKAHFECLVFVRVGPVFRREEVLDAITAQLNLHDHEMIMEGSFTQRFYRILTLRKSLIVLDDVWDDMDLLIRFSLHVTESHILVMKSWELLRRNVFGEEECPPQLLKPGKKIAKDCEGLPLLINAVAPILLSEAQRNPECWNSVAEKPHSLLEEASHQISELRYLALTCNAELPASISKLLKLKFLIIHQHSGIKRVGVESYVPAEVWDLQKLEHLEIMGRNLPDPPHPGAVLPNLKKLLDVGVESCTKAVLESLPDLEKLRIQIEFAPNATETMSCFDHISCLRSLKSFHSLIINPTLLLPPLPLAILPSRLAKLALSGFGYPWEHMRKISELQYLIELKLQHYAFRGEKWDAIVIKFPYLRSLTIEDTDLVEWTAEYESFFYLEHLTFKNCYKLREIPYCPRVTVIKLVDYNPLAEACAKQKYPGMIWNSRTEKVSANYSWK
ncbi:hypothetical protein C2S51_003353 [Perilla frutescens var. frutescens]|nr:hypothetical protein C2S51_003353 [Perilla frutescens var. frutescens]